MKKLFAILLVLCSLSSFGQITNGIKFSELVTLDTIAANVYAPVTVRVGSSWYNRKIPLSLFARRDSAVTNLFVSHDTLYQVVRDTAHVVIVSPALDTATLNHTIDSIIQRYNIVFNQYFLPGAGDSSSPITIDTTKIQKKLYLDSTLAFNEDTLGVRLDSAEGEAPNVIGQTADGLLHKYAVPSFVFDQYFTGTGLGTDSIHYIGGSAATDTTSLSNRIDLKLNLSDTAVMLANYRHWLFGYAPATRTISTTAPLAGGGDLSANRTLSITQATTSTNGYLSSADWNTFNNKQSALTFAQSLLNTSGTVALVNDNATPGNNYVYGTNASGTKGWQSSVPYALTGLRKWDWLNYDSTNSVWVNYRPEYSTVNTLKMLVIDTITRKSYYQDIPGSSGSTYWGLSGTGSTTAGTNFVGTTDAQDLYIKANGTTKAIFRTDGKSIIEGIALYKGTGTATYGNLAIGDSILKANTTGTYNVGVGDSVLVKNTTGTNNTGFGSRVLVNNTTGSNNGGFGDQVLYNNTTGGSNLASGIGALYSNTTGSSNVGYGFNALSSNTTGSNSTALGYFAMNSWASTTGWNTAVGYQAMTGAGSGAGNVAVGYQAGSTSSGSENTAIGYTTKFGTSGSYNTAIGSSNFINLTSGSKNTAIGYSVFPNATTLSNSVGIGSQAGQYAGTILTTLTTGDSLVLIGYVAKTKGIGEVNEMVIGPNTVGLGSNSIVIGNPRNTMTAMPGRLTVGLSGQGSNGEISEPASGAMLDMKGTGFLLLPRMTSAQRDALSKGTPLQSVSWTTGTGMTNGTYTITFSGGGGSGAAGTLTISGGGAGVINMTSLGNGYTSAPTASISGAGGSGGGFTVTIQLFDGAAFYCTDCTATNASTGVMQIYQASTTSWKNLW